MKRVDRALPLLPVAAAAALAALWLALGWPDPRLYLRADAVTLLIFAGLLASMIWMGVRTVRERSRRLVEEALADAAGAQADAHRRFLRRLDHEIKNPLTAMRAGLANARDPAAGPALASVRAQVDRLARLSADLRKLADLETQPLEEEPVQLAELLAEMHQMACERPEAGERHLRLSLPSAPWPLPPVAGDRDLLLLALHNLLDNALKFTRPGDTVELRATEDGAWVVVEVADTGPGIPAEDLPHLGEELYRGAAARSVEGSGLGLALVQAIVARHGGSMGVRSRLGQGTAVALRLPARRG